MEGFINALGIMFTPTSLLYVLLGVAAGILGGALPGVSTVMTVALLLPLTYTMPPEMAIMTLCAIQVGATYGGSISASLLNIPGTPASAATAIEGYAITKNGEAKTSVGLGAVSSFVGSVIGIILLITTTPLMVKLAMKFGPWEFFWFSMFGLVICANLSRGSFLKGIIGAVFGIIIALIGLDPIFGEQRFTFGQINLLDGINLVPAMIGLYGMSEVLNNLRLNDEADVAPLDGGRLFPYDIVLKHWLLTIRVSILGFLVGVVPGVGANIASWVGYDHARSGSKNPEKFGVGSYEGLIGSEAANNACVPGSYAPLLALAIPGDNVTAMILGALIIYGVQPGPTFLIQQPHWLYMIALAMLVATIVFVIIGPSCARFFMKSVTMPTPAIMTIVATLCVIGSFAAGQRVFDVYVMFTFGLLGLYMRKNGFPIAPLLLGMVLGNGIVDTNFRRAMLAGDYSIVPFFTRPISLVLMAIVIIMVVMQIRKDFQEKARIKTSTPITPK